MPRGLGGWGAGKRGWYRTLGSWFYLLERHVFFHYWKYASWVLVFCIPVGFKWGRSILNISLFFQGPCSNGSSLTPGFPVVLFVLATLQQKGGPSRRVTGQLPMMKVPSLGIPYDFQHSQIVWSCKRNEKGYSLKLCVCLIL